MVLRETIARRKKKKSSPSVRRCGSTTKQSKSSPPDLNKVVETPATAILTPEEDEQRRSRDPSPQIGGRRTLFPEESRWNDDNNNRRATKLRSRRSREYHRIPEFITPSSLEDDYERSQQPRFLKQSNLYYIWIICLVGLTGVSMVSMIHHNTAATSHHVAIVLKQPHVRQNHHGVNLHQLSQRLLDEQKVENRETLEELHKSEKKKKKKRNRNQKAIPPRVYQRVPPGSLGMDSIPRITLPKDMQRQRYLVSNDLYIPSSGSRRVVVLSHDDNDDKPVRIVPRTLETYPADVTDSTQLYGILDSSDERLATMERHQEPDECVPMADWQTTFHPLCNSMHELDLVTTKYSEDDVSLLGSGYWRSAWKYDSMSGHNDLSERDRVILKTLKLQHRFEEAFYENHRVDAIVLERLTASPHVIHIFGFCGHSALTEFADDKRLGELADKKRNVKRARLEIARDIATGLADVHGIDGVDYATFVHLDINPANVVSIDGTLKLNDFNIGVLRKWNITSNQPCGISVKYPNPQWRSPEEARREHTLTEKVDVFSLGHILFRLVCGHEPWHKLEENGQLPPKDVLNEKVQRGVLPRIPDSVMRSSDPEIIAIREAMLRCYTYDPVLRPSAREIANFLQNALDRLE